MCISAIQHIAQKKHMLQKNPKHNFCFCFLGFFGAGLGFSPPLFSCVCRCKALPHTPCSGLKSSGCSCLSHPLGETRPAVRAGDGMPVPASATPHHVHLLQHRDMPCHEMKQEYSPRLAAGQKVSLHSCFSPRQFMQLASQPVPASLAQDQFCGVLFQLCHCSASLHHATPHTVTLDRTRG